MNLVERQPPDPAAVLVAAVQVAHLGPPAVDRLNAAGRVEQDLAIGQIGPLVVGHAQSERQLPAGSPVQIQLVQVIVIQTIRLLPGKQHAPAVVRHVGVANDAVGVVDERLDVDLAVAQGRQAQSAAGNEVPLGLGVGLAFGVRIVRPAHRRVPGEDQLRALLLERPQADLATQAAGVDVELQPTGVLYATAGLDQIVEPRVQLGAGRPHLVERSADQVLLGLRRAVRGKVPAKISPGLGLARKVLRSVLGEPIGLGEILPEMPEQPVGHLPAVGSGLQGRVLQPGSGREHALHPSRLLHVPTVRRSGVESRGPENGQQHERLPHRSLRGCLA